MATSPAVGTGADASPQWLDSDELASCRTSGRCCDRRRMGPVTGGRWSRRADGLCGRSRGGRVRASRPPAVPAAVERAYCRQLELGDDQAWPPLTGYWRDDGRFVLTDGRHRFIAAVMLGVEYVLAAWLVAPAETCLRCGGTKLDGHGEPCQFCAL